MTRRLALFACLVALGCSRGASVSSSAPSFPTKDDAIILDGRPLSIGAYEAIRKELSRSTQALKSEDAFRIAEATLLLQHRSLSRGNEINPKEALMLARVAWGDGEFDVSHSASQKFIALFGAVTSRSQLKTTILELLKTAVIQRNLAALQEVERTVSAIEHP